jgi:hypothetical protein
MTQHRPGLIDMPDRIARLPVDERGYPVPRFVATIDGKPDFRVVDPRWMVHAVNHQRCWLCGEALGQNLAFVLGPMCAINRINSEPPCHLDCARFAAKNCPFLARPMARRRAAGLPEDRQVAPGLPIERNPGCCAVWVTKSYKWFKATAGNAGVLFRVGPCLRIEFYAEGRAATRAEVEASIAGGLPLLQAEAHAEGVDAERELMRMVATFNRLLETTYKEADAS